VRLKTADAADGGFFRVSEIAAHSCSSLGGCSEGPRAQNPIGRTRGLLIGAHRNACPLPLAGGKACSVCWAQGLTLVPSFRGLLGQLGQISYQPRTVPSGTGGDLGAGRDHEPHERVEFPERLGRQIGKSGT
jgi:hypothetical protein